MNIKAIAFMLIIFVQYAQITYANEELPDDPTLKQIYLEGEKQRIERIAYIQNQIDTLKATYSAIRKGEIDTDRHYIQGDMAIVDGKYYFRNRESKRAATLNARESLEKSEQLLERLQDKKALIIPCYVATEIQHRQVGYIRGGYNKPAWLGGAPVGDVMQIVEDGNAILLTVGRGEFRREYWLRDVNTTGVVTNDRFELSGAWQYSTTHTYTTIDGGTNTVPVLERVDLQPLIDWHAKKQDAE